MRKLYILIITFFVTSCSWQNFNPFGNPSTNTDKVIKNFDLDDDIVDKFSTEKVVEVKKSKPEEKKTKPEKKVTEKKKVAKKKAVNKKKKVSKKKVEKKSATKEVVVEDYKEEKKSIYPDDYPENFIKLDQTSKKLWESLTPINPVGEQTFMDITYGGFVVGKIAITIKPKKVIGGEEVYHYYAKLKSAPFYKYVYTLDDVIESYVKVSDFLPVKYSLIQRESKQSIDDIQLFDREALMTYYRLKKVKRGKKSFKKNDTYIPFYSQDALSAIFMLRSLPLNTGDKIKIPIVTRGKISLMSVEVLGRDKIDTKLGRKNAIKISAITQYSGDLVKKGSMTYWISDDKERIFLKFKAKIKLGAVNGDIVSYKK
jgi:hypothetical protein